MPALSLLLNGFERPSKKKSKIAQSVKIDSLITIETKDFKTLAMNKFRWSGKPLHKFTHQKRFPESIMFADKDFSLDRTFQLTFSETGSHIAGLATKSEKRLGSRDKMIFVASPIQRRLIFGGEPLKKNEEIQAVSPSGQTVVTKFRINYKDTFFSVWKPAGKTYKRTITFNFDEDDFSFISQPKLLNDRLLAYSKSNKTHFLSIEGSKIKGAGKLDSVELFDYSKSKFCLSSDQKSIFFVTPKDKRIWEFDLDSISFVGSLKIPTDEEIASNDFYLNSKESLIRVVTRPNSATWFEFDPVQPDESMKLKSKHPSNPLFSSAHDLTPNLLFGNVNSIWSNVHQVEIARWNADISSNRKYLDEGVIVVDSSFSIPPKVKIVGTKPPKNSFSNTLVVGFRKYPTKKLEKHDQLLTPGDIIHLRKGSQIAVEVYMPEDTDKQRVALVKEQLIENLKQQGYVINNSAKLHLMYSHSMGKRTKKSFTLSSTDRYSSLSKNTETLSISFRPQEYKVVLSYNNKQIWNRQIAVDFTGVKDVAEFRRIERKVDIVSSERFLELEKLKDFRILNPTKVLKID